MPRLDGMPTHREARLAYRSACAADPTLRERDRAAAAAEHDAKLQGQAARPLIALAEQDARAHLPHSVEVIVAGHTITLGVDATKLGQGAREAILAGLRSLWNSDDASALIVRTGRTMGEAARTERERMRAYDARTGYRSLEVHGSSLPADSDSRPETVRVRHTSAWCPDLDKLEEYLDRQLGVYAGRIVRAGLDA